MRIGGAALAGATHVSDPDTITDPLDERVIAATQSGIVITDARRPDHPIISVNPAFERITGASFERYLQEDVIAR